jgi:polyribonucleotide nucleotidyltransferase
LRHRKILEKAEYLACPLLPAVEQFDHIGDEIDVRVKEIDNLGRVNLTRRGLFSAEEMAAAAARPDSGDGSGGEGDRPDRFDRRGARDHEGRGPRRKRRPS